MISTIRFVHVSGAITFSSSSSNCRYRSAYVATNQRGRMDKLSFFKRRRTIARKVFEFKTYSDFGNAKKISLLFYVIPPNLCAIFKYQ